MLKRALDWRMHNGPIDADLADSWNNYGLFQNDLGHLSAAETALRKAIDLHRQVAGDDTARIAFPLHNLALTLKRQGRLEEARQAARQALVLKRRDQVQAASIAVTQAVLAGIERSMGLLDDALHNAEQSLALRRETYGEDSPMITSGMSTLARVLLARGEIEPARALYEQAVDIHVRSGNEGTLSAARTHRAYGHFLRDIGEKAGAQREFEAAYAAAVRQLPAGSGMLAEYDLARTRDTTHRPP
jgi:tetratricopeptide (TPR) repeat protein